jgi:hypothetical protein
MWGAHACVDDGAGQYDAAEVGQGVLVVAGGDATPLLESVEAAFDGVAQCVERGVERGRSPTVGSFGLTSSDLVGSFRNGVFDSAGT